MKRLRKGGGPKQLVCLHGEGGGAMRSQTKGEGGPVSGLLRPEQGDDILPPVTAIDCGKAGPLLFPLAGRSAPQQKQ